MPTDQQGMNQTTRAVLELRSRIMSGRLPGGTRLLEVQMSEQLGISRTPIREAMGRLAEEGLLERASGGGYRVRTFPATDVVDTIALRGLLEGAAARRAAELGVGPDMMARFEALLAELDLCFGTSFDDIDLERYSEANRQFHEALAEASGSAVLRREIDRVARLPFASPSAFLTDDSRLSSVRRSLWVAQAQHRAIVEAIAGRQSARAEAIAREHVLMAQRNVELVLGGGADQATDLVGLLARNDEH